MKKSPAAVLFFTIRPKNAHLHVRMLRTFLCACLFILLAAFPHPAVSSSPSTSSPSGELDPSAPALVLGAFIAVPPGPDIQKMQSVQELWATVLARHVPEKAFGNDIQSMPAPVLVQWKNLSKRMPSWTAVEKLQNITGFFNRWDSIGDLENYGAEEYWAIPEEFLEKGGGDCEDFAIIKYFALRYFGWPEQDLWILLGKDNKADRYHAVLAARTGEKIFILDNLSRPSNLLLSDKQYTLSFTPLYAISELGAWIFKEK